ncbi:uncharacterized protein LOC131642472 isoform X2 [Vicia villosa]|uniref:uncharacterized protein LOC131642472 isoform X2 n=1 Tax=Vicia villosa TaxID=3911 RepID=UPI00273B6E22|nr:uncharacterized protein LOC131642472 isoform X2 [Vicia villosa]
MKEILFMALAHLLSDNINNIVQGFRSECREMVEANAVITPIQYYIHSTVTGDRKLRSVTEVVNKLLPEGYAKLDSRKRKKNVELEDNDEENNFEFEANENNISQVSQVKKQKIVEVGKNISPRSSTCTEKIIGNKEFNEVGDFSCFSLEIEDKENNMDDVLISGLLNSQEISSEFLLYISDMQPIVSVNQDILEDMLKDHVENDWTLIDEVLYEIREDFSEYDELIASFLK